MNSRSSAVRLLVVFVLLLIPFAASAQRIALGIPPIYDSSSEAWNQNLLPRMTYLFYQELLKSPDIQPVLLSPGGLYDPGSSEALLDLARSSKVDALLVMRQMPSLRDGDRHRKLNFEVYILDIASGKRSLKSANNNVSVSVSDLQNTSLTPLGFWGNPLEFQRQPLGKATMTLIAWTQNYLTQTLTALQPSRSAAEPYTDSTPCQMEFRVRYAAKHTASKSYSLIANDKEQSSTIREGAANFLMTSGQLGLRVQVEDAPYRMPTQSMYLSSTLLNCYDKKHTLVMELGTAGEALLHWE
jgi:hypothetical protein